ncbi:Uncharacterised protein [Yersinia kristensenii]|nr:hypothetical protein BZ20_2930 [Yersinia pseudotuberculosis]CNI04458.1 Uncharacterised protein [Yersinia kristensenii]VEE70688.1 Uncharacterised protein [Yersinia pseudotuberculosis]
MHLFVLNPLWEKKLKLSNCLSLLALILPLSGCASRPDYTLNPPASSEWVTVTVKLPSQTEVTPMDVLYRSDKCQREDYDSTTESHIRKERGFNPRVERMTQQGRGDIWEARIALDGGGKCEWQLSAMRIGVKLTSSNSLTQGKSIIATNYVFDFDNQGYSGGFGVGKAQDVNDNLHLKTELFPMIVINNMFHETSIEMFGGDTGYKKWSRHYRSYGTKNIFIEPVVYMNKVVVLESPKSKSEPAGMTITYPNGKIAHERTIIPDYEKLLSMK